MNLQFGIIIIGQFGITILAMALDLSIIIKNDPYLNGTNWVPYYGTSADLVISCPQVLFSQPFSMIPGMVTNVPLPQDTMLYQFDAVESQASMSPPASRFRFMGLTIIKQQAPPSRLIPPPCSAPITVSWPGRPRYSATLSFSVRRCGNGDQYDRYHHAFDDG